MKILVKSLVALGLLVGSASAAEYEYKLIGTDGPPTDAALNEAAKVGWRLKQIIPGTDAYYVYLEREIGLKVASPVGGEQAALTEKKMRALGDAIACVFSQSYLEMRSNLGQADLESIKQLCLDEQQVDPSHKTADDETSVWTMIRDERPGSEKVGCLITAPTGARIAKWFNTKPSTNTVPDGWTMKCRDL
jgi:hypothetical protein